MARSKGDIIAPASQPIAVGHAAAAAKHASAAREFAVMGQASCDSFADL
jgi:hypothetical protein